MKTYAKMDFRNSKISNDEDSPRAFYGFLVSSKILYKTYKLILIATHDQHLISQLPGKITRLNSK